MNIIKQSVFTIFPHPSGGMDATDDDYSAEITIEISADRDASTGRWSLVTVYLCAVQVTINGVKRVVQACEKLGSEADTFFTEEVEAELERQWQMEREEEDERLRETVR